MNVYWSIKFSTDHVAPVARIRRRPGEEGLFRVPNERAESARVPFTITRARPGRFITELGMIVPDERPAVSCALIRSLAERDIREQQERSANKE